MSFLDRQAIPDLFLRSDDEKFCFCSFEDCIEQLKAFSFITNARDVGIALKAQKRKRRPSRLMELMTGLRQRQLRGKEGDKKESVQGEHELENNETGKGDAEEIDPHACDPEKDDTNKDGSSESESTELHSEKGDPSTNDSEEVDPNEGDFGHGHYNMHRLVQLACHAWLDQNESDGGERFAWRALQLMSKKFSSRTDSVEDIHPRLTRTGINAHYVPHIQALLALQWRSTTNEIRLAQATLHLEAAVNMSEVNSVMRRAHATKSFEIRREILGPDHIETCNSITMLAVCSLHRRLEGGLWNDEDTRAELLFHQALDGFYKSLDVGDLTVQICTLMMLELLTSREPRRDDDARDFLYVLFDRLDGLPNNGEKVWIKVSYSFQKYLSYYDTAAGVFPAFVAPGIHIREFLIRLEKRYQGSVPDGFLEEKDRIKSVDSSACRARIPDKEKSAREIAQIRQEITESWARTDTNARISETEGDVVSTGVTK
ncbi:hypothetical protein MMC28_006114 [Mycoblastus sanguinarius]|nr:hypothetical protein [Mycoblastus sanguinarius]